MRLCRGVAHALTHLHLHRQMIHADIKPANLIVSKETRKLTLIDFGSAWAVLTKTLVNCSELICTATPDG